MTAEQRPLPPALLAAMELVLAESTLAQRHNDGRMTLRQDDHGWVAGFSWAAPVLGGAVLHGYGETQAVAFCRLGMLILLGPLPPTPTPLPPARTNVLLRAFKTLRVPLPTWLALDALVRAEVDATPIAPRRPIGGDPSPPAGR